MGKRKHRHRSSDDEDRGKLRNRVKWLEDQILKQREEKYDNTSGIRHCSRRPSTRSRSRSRSHRRDDSYDSSRSHRRQYRSDHGSDKENRDKYGHYRDDDRYSRRGSSFRRQQSYSSTDSPRKSRSRSPRQVSNSQTRSNTRSRSPDKPDEGEKSSDDITLQANIRTPTGVLNSNENAAVGQTDESTAGTKPLTETASSEAIEIELDADVLQVFGERLRPDRVLAPAVHSHFATIWCEIIEKGLPAEDRKTFLKQFPPPKNCLLMDPPKLNLEVKAALESTIIKRDERIVEKQEKIAASLAGVGKTIELLLKSNPADKKQYLEPLNAVAKLLADLQHDETSIRKSLILKNIKAPSKDTLKDASTDEWLFGKELNEKIKAAKALQQSSKDLKPSFKQPSDQGKSSKNSKGPPHRSQYKSNTYSRGGGYRQNYSNYNRGHSHNRGNKSTSRGRNSYQKQEQPTVKKSDS